MSPDNQDGNTVGSTAPGGIPPAAPPRAGFIQKLFSSPFFLPLFAVFAIEAFSRSLFLIPFAFVPLAILAILKGNRPALLSLALFSLVHLAIGLVFANASPLPFTVNLVETLIFILFGVSAIMVSRPVGPRSIIKLGISSVLLSLASWGLGSLLFSMPAVRALLESEGRSMIEQSIALLEVDTVQFSLLNDQLTWENLVRSTLFVASHGGLLVGSFLVLAATVRLSSLFASRSLPGLRYRGLALFFKPPAFMVWILSVSLACLLLSDVLTLPLLAIPAANAAILVALIYAYAGFGVFQWAMMRFSLPRILQVILTFIVFMLLMNMRIAPFVIGAYALLGVVETWLPIRAAVNREPPSTPEV